MSTEAVVAVLKHKKIKKRYFGNEGDVIQTSTVRYELCTLEALTDSMCPVLVLFQTNICTQTATEPQRAETYSKPRPP